MTQTERSANSHALSWVLGLLAALLLYVLSIGPVCYLVNARIISGPAAWAGTLYSPLFWLGENTFLKEPFEAYLGWWSGLAIKTPDFVP